MLDKFDLGEYVIPVESSISKAIKFTHPELTFPEIEDKVKAKLGIDTISFTTSPYELIIDDTSVPKCLLHVVNEYNAPRILIGSMIDCGLNCTDLEQLGVLTKLFDIPDSSTKEH